MRSAYRGRMHIFSRGETPTSASGSMRRSEAVTLRLQYRKSDEYSQRFASFGTIVHLKTWPNRLHCDRTEQSTSKLGLRFFSFSVPTRLTVTGQTGRDTMSQPDERDRSLTTSQLAGHPLDILTSPTGPQRTTIFKLFQLSMQFSTRRNLGPGFTRTC